MSANTAKYLLLFFRLNFFCNIHGNTQAKDKNMDCFVCQYVSFLYQIPAKSQLRELKKLPFLLNINHLCSCYW